VGTELTKPAVKVALLAGKNLVHHCLEVVVNSPLAHPSEELEGSDVGVKDHLLGLPGIGGHQKIPAVA
jgi:hypothetical protein